MERAPATRVGARKAHVRHAAAGPRRAGCTWHYVSMPLICKLVGMTLPCWLHASAVPDRTWEEKRGERGSGGQKSAVSAHTAPTRRRLALQEKKRREEHCCACFTWGLPTHAIRAMSDALDIISRLASAGATAPDDDGGEDAAAACAALRAAELEPLSAADVAAIEAAAANPSANDGAWFDATDAGVRTEDVGR